jgi:N-acetylmuramoyl-L-alanine amidase
LAIKIFIDQGHNPSGVNAGAEGFGMREQDITYNVGTYLATLLNQDSRFEVRLSRNTPEESLGYSNVSSLAERVGMANSWPADYFISLHANANENPAINGAEVYVAENYTQSYYLGEQILNAIVNYVGIKNNGLRLNPSLYVLRNTNMPAALVEMGYITNYSDSQRLRNQQWDYAYAIYQGLLNYFGLANS